MSIKNNGHYRVATFTLIATVVSLLFGYLYYASPTSIVIDFDEKGIATIRSQEKAGVPKPGELAGGWSEERADEYFQKRIEWMKGNRDVVSDYHQKKSRAVAIYLSWLPWCFLAWFVRGKSLKYSVSVFVIPSVVTLIGWFSINELILMILAYVVVSATLVVRKNMSMVKTLLSRCPVRSVRAASGSGIGEFFADFSFFPCGTVHRTGKNKVE
jgi:hypothetical protein